MTMEQNLDVVRKQKEQEEDRHAREKLALEQHKTSENQRHQNNIQRLKDKEQSLLNRQQIRSYTEYLDSVALFVDNTLQQLKEITEY